VVDVAGDGLGADDGAGESMPLALVGGAGARCAMGVREGLEGAAVLRKARAVPPRMTAPLAAGPKASARRRRWRIEVIVTAASRPHLWDRSTCDRTVMRRSQPVRGGRRRADTMPTMRGSQSKSRVPRLPSPSRGRLLLRAHNRLARSRLHWWCGTRPVLALIRPYVAMGAPDVLTVCAALAPTGARWWVAGGWGVDALLGRQNRRHADLDVVTGNDPAEVTSQVAALGHLGLRVLRERLDPEFFMPRTIWLADDAGHSVELYPVDLDDNPLLGPHGEPAFTTGLIAGTEVPCLAAQVHVRVRDYNYRLRSSDVHDLLLLDAEPSPIHRHRYRPLGREHTSRVPRGTRVVLGAHNRLARSHLGALCDTRPFKAVTAPLLEMRAADVLTVADAVAACTDDWWLAGGWGVDALIGRQTRRHSDVDVLIHADHAVEAEVAAALQRLGLRRLGERYTPNAITTRRVWFADSAGHSVDLLPVDLDRHPFRHEDGVANAFSVGVVGGRRLPCLSRDVHLNYRLGFPLRDIDQTDMRALEEELPSSPADQ
jgi:lincosamide nucleotidyltransferase A/C/D/E